MVYCGELWFVVVNCGELWFITTHGVIIYFTKVEAAVREMSVSMDLRWWLRSVLRLPRMEV